MRKHILILILFAKVAVGQEVEIPHDTSFSFYSTWIKERKKYPFIQIAQPASLMDVKSKENIVYSFAGGRNLLADVFYPAKKSDKGYPAVILIFGGGWKSGDKSQSVPMIPFKNI